MPRRTPPRERQTILMEAGRHPHGAGPMERASAGLGLFERYLSAWVGLAIAAGLFLGVRAPDIFTLIAGWEIAGVNLMVAVLVWVMIFPMMVRVDLSSAFRVSGFKRGLTVTLVINWLIKPFTMAALGVLFFQVLFADLVSPGQAQQYIAGMILLGAAPCTAMVFVWSHLTKGDPTFTLIQVSLNDLIMIVAYAPIVGLLLGVTDLPVAWDTLFLSVVLFVVVPLGAGWMTRRGLLKHGGRAGLDAFSGAAKPFTMVGLIATVLLLFGFQGAVILANPLVILLIATPLLIQGYGIFLLAYFWARAWKIPFAIAAPAALIGSSNFFELAVAVAISLFGLDSGAALATVVGVLVEVPVMLSLVSLANRTRHMFAAAPAPA